MIILEIWKNSIVSFELVTFSEKRKFKFFLSNYDRNYDFGYNSEGAGVWTFGSHLCVMLEAESGGVKSSHFSLPYLFWKKSYKKFMLAILLLCISYLFCNSYLAENQKKILLTVKSYYCFRILRL